MKREAEMILFLSDARGQYIPRDFALEIDRSCISGVEDSDLDYLARGPGGMLDDNLELIKDGPYAETVRAEHYWDVWTDVCDSAVITAKDSGKQYFVYQDGDCLLVEMGAEFNDGPPIDGVETDWYMDDGEED